jgi:hypothetical protein
MELNVYTRHRAPLKTVRHCSLAHFTRMNLRYLLHRTKLRPLVSIGLQFEDIT